MGNAEVKVESGPVSNAKAPMYRNIQNYTNIHIHISNHGKFGATTRSDADI